MKSIKFSRFKKKSLILLQKLIDPDLLAKKIKNRKLSQALQTINLTKGIKEEGKLGKNTKNLFPMIMLMSDNILLGNTKKEGLKIWDLTTGKCIKKLQEPLLYVDQLLKINENIFVSTSYQGLSINIWDLRTGNCLKTLEGHRFKISSKLLKLNEFQIVSGSCDRTMKIWDLRTGNCIKTLVGYSDYVSFILKMKEKKIISGHDRGSIKIWNITAGNCIRTLREHYSITYGISNLLKINENKIVSCEHNELIIWDLLTGKPIKNHDYWGARYRILLKINKNKFVSNFKNFIKIWDSETGICINKLQAHREGRVYGVCV